MSRFEGRYRNVQYAYAATIPGGWVGHGPPSPAPEHGFGVVLSWTARAYLYADGSYEVMDDKTVEEAAARQLGYTRQEASRMRSARAVKARLGPLKAVRQIARYECQGLKDIYVTDEFVALSGDGGVVYKISLSTVEKRYRKDRQVLEEMARSFAVLPQPTFSRMP